MPRHNLEPEAIDFLRVNAQPMGDRRQWEKAPVPPTAPRPLVTQLWNVLYNFPDGPQQDWARVAYCLIKAHIIAIFPLPIFSK